MRILLSACLLFFYSLNVYSADRSKLTPLLVTPNNEVQIFFEPGSVNRIGSVIRYRLHLLFTPSNQDPFNEDGIIHEFSEPVSKVVDTIELSCDYQSFISVKKDFFGIDANLLWTYSPEEQEPEMIDLEQISGVMWQTLCRPGNNSKKQST